MDCFDFAVGGRHVSRARGGWTPIARGAQAQNRREFSENTRPSHRHHEIGVAGDAPSAVRSFTQDAQGVSRHRALRLAARRHDRPDAAAGIGAITKGLDFQNLRPGLHGDVRQALVVGGEFRLANGARPGVRKITSSVNIASKAGRSRALLAATQALISSRIARPSSGAIATLCLSCLSRRPRPNQRMGSSLGFPAIPSRDAGLGEGRHAVVAGDRGPDHADRDRCA